MDKQYKNNQTEQAIDDGQASILQATIQHEEQLQDRSHQAQVSLFDAQYNTLDHSHRDEPPHAPNDHSAPQHAPNHSAHEHSNPSASRRYLRDPDTGLWVNQVRSDR